MPQGQTPEEFNDGPGNYQAQVLVDLEKTRREFVGYKEAIFQIWEVGFAIRRGRAVTS